MHDDDKTMAWTSLLSFLLHAVHLYMYNRFYVYRKRTAPQPWRRAVQGSWRRALCYGKTTHLEAHTCIIICLIVGAPCIYVILHLYLYISYNAVCRKLYKLQTTYTQRLLHVDTTHSDCKNILHCIMRYASLTVFFFWSILNDSVLYTTSHRMWFHSWWPSKTIIATRRILNTSSVFRFVCVMFAKSKT